MTEKLHNHEAWTISLSVIPTVEDPRDHQVILTRDKNNLVIHARGAAVKDLLNSRMAIRSFRAESGARDLYQQPARV